MIVVVLSYYCTNSMETFAGQKQVRENVEVLKEYYHELTGWLDQVKVVKPVDMRKVAEEKRIEGNLLCKQGLWVDAITRFTEGIGSCPTNVLYSNRALCWWKLGKYVECVKDCKESLKIARSVKALFRKGCADVKLERWLDAKRDLEECMAMTDDAEVQESIRIELKRVEEGEVGEYEAQMDLARKKLCSNIPAWCDEGKLEDLVNLPISGKEIGTGGIGEKSPKLANHVNKNTYIPKSVRLRHNN